jgi:hypothetical protein
MVMVLITLAVAAVILFVEGQHSAMQRRIKARVKTEDRRRARLK